MRVSAAIGLIGMCASLGSGPALAVVPDAPTVTVSGAPKQLAFKWNYVARANWYELWFKRTRAPPG